jgi:hypothetical protein
MSVSSQLSALSYSTVLQGKVVLLYSALYQDKESLIEHFLETSEIKKVIEVEDSSLMQQICSPGIIYL